MIPSLERLIVSDAFVVLLRSSGMRGFPPSRVFLDLCANSWEPMHNAVQCAVLGCGLHRRARAWELVHHPLM